MPKTTRIPSFPKRLESFWSELLACMLEKVDLPSSATKIMRFKLLTKQLFLKKNYFKEILLVSTERSHENTQVKCPPDKWVSDGICTSVLMLGDLLLVSGTRNLTWTRNQKQGSAGLKKRASSYCNKRDVCSQSAREGLHRMQAVLKGKRAAEQTQTM